MGVNLSIKNVPAETVERLKARAKKNHRSLQGELRALVDQAIEVPPANEMTVDALIKQGRSRGLSTPDESARWVRDLRDSR
ncbi:MAG TPA: Arc family DNA-binding protein [Rhizomicrobium sp.]|jgi:plasmid stability protein